MNLAPLAGLLTRVSSAEGPGLSAVDDVFRVQRGTTARLWPVANDHAPIGARILSVGPLSPAWGDIEIDVPQQSRLTYEADATFVGTITCPYSITDEYDVRTGSIVIECTTAAPVPLGQSMPLEVYAGTTRWCRSLLNCSGQSLSIIGVSAPPVGSAYVVETETSTTGRAPAVEVYAPPGVVTSYSLAVTIQDGLARQTTTQLDVSVVTKPNVTWPSGIGHFTADERADYQAWLGRKPTGGAHWVNYTNRDCPTCPTYSDTMEMLAGGPYDQLDFFGHFFTRPKASGMWDSLRAATDRDMVRNIVYPLMPQQWSNRNNARPLIWFDVSTTTGETSGLRHQEWWDGWYAFGYRWATVCHSLSLSPGNLIFDMGWEFTGNPAWRVGPHVGDFIAAWRVMVDRMRAGGEAYGAGMGGFRFAMRPARNANDGHAYSALYPGPAYVDVLGVSTHDGESDMGTEEGWSKLLFGGSGKYGIMEALSQCLVTGKSYGVGEWDIYFNYVLNTGNPDEPVRHTWEPGEVLQRLFRWFHHNRTRLAIEAYLHEANWLFDSSAQTRGAEHAQVYRTLWTNS